MTTISGNDDGALAPEYPLLRPFCDLRGSDLRGLYALDQQMPDQAATFEELERVQTETLRNRARQSRVKGRGRNRARGADAEQAEGSSRQLSSLFQEAAFGRIKARQMQLEAVASSLSHQLAADIVESKSTPKQQQTPDRVAK